MSGPPWSIRRYQPDDVQAVWDLHVLGLQHAGAYSDAGPWDDDLRDVEHSYLARRGEFLVVAHQGAIIGMGGLRPVSADTAEVKRMRVHPHYQRRGIGDSIYDHLEARARQLRYKKLVLDTTVQQAAAQALYRKKGFTEAGRTIMGGFDCVLFEKNLMVASDYEPISPRYDLARGGPLERLDPWRIALSPFFGRDGSSVLDLGSGTGYWAVTLGGWFGLHVVALEPSQAMRREALSKRRHPTISYLGGRAEKLPLRNGSCESAWLSTVVHHISYLGACARELRRVLTPDGRVLIRNAFSGRTDGILWLQYFDHVKHLAEARWPTVDEVIEAFEPAGFRLERLQSVEEVTKNLSSYARSVGVRADSTLASISDEDFERGMRNLERAVAAEPEPKPVVTRLDLLVLKAVTD